ncbi:hypothetical protein FWH09_00975 [Candidatus Saccharibacteria bacterium]|nr:hypothetical protein [Candidatus Saccharibacteria bacterium]
MVKQATTAGDTEKSRAKIAHFKKTYEVYQEEPGFMGGNNPESKIIEIKSFVIEQPEDLCRKCGNPEVVIEGAERLSVLCDIQLICKQIGEKSIPVIDEIAKKHLRFSAGTSEYLAYLRNSVRE